MPLFLDRHDLQGATATDAAAAHLLDLEVQDRFGVQYVNYWFDYERQTVFCLAKGPDSAAIEAVHRASHGLTAHNIIEVDERLLTNFMGRIVEHPPGEPYVETAFRAVLFTDIEDSTGLTERLGDAAAMAVLRTHDRIVRDALARRQGSEIKHTGDGIMASFTSVVNAIHAAIDTQREVALVSGRDDLPMHLRIGIAAGEPVTERDDLFGAAVQLAARLCNRAMPEEVLVPSAVRDLAIGKGFTFARRGTLRLKGFAESVRVFGVAWRPPDSGPAC